MNELHDGHSEARRIFTIGYEGKSLEDFLRILMTNQVDAVVDVRYRPQSRKKGFSKSALIRALGDLDIDYWHDRGLGTPPDVLKEFRETGEYDWNAYLSFLDHHADVVEQLAAVASEQSIVLLCYEADYRICHRKFVAIETSEINGVPIFHLD